MGHRSQGEENMDFDTEIKVFLAYAAGVLAVYLMGRFSADPLKDNPQAPDKQSGGRSGSFSD